MLAHQRVEETAFSLSERVPEPPVDRRRSERQLTILRVGIVEIEGARELCLIRNVSAGGMMAHIYAPLREGQSVAVELKSNQRISGRVVWTSDGNAGIAFDSPVDIAELLANPPQLANGWRPRLPRVEVDKLATLRAGAETRWVQVRDVSQGGVKVETERPLEPGTGVVVTMEHFEPLHGTVRWYRDGACGVAFNQLIPFDRLIAWLKR